MTHEESPSGVLLLLLGNESVNNKETKYNIEANNNKETNNNKEANNNKETCEKEVNNNKEANNNPDTKRIPVHPQGLTRTHFCTDAINRLNSWKNYSLSWYRRGVIWIVSQCVRRHATRYGMSRDREFTFPPLSREDSRHDRSQT